MRAGIVPAPSADAAGGGGSCEEAGGQAEGLPAGGLRFTVLIPVGKLQRILSGRQANPLVTPELDDGFLPEFHFRILSTAPWLCE